MKKYECILMLGDKATLNGHFYPKVEIDKVKPRKNVRVVFEDTKKIVGRAVTFSKDGNLVALIVFDKASFDVSETASVCPTFLIKDVTQKDNLTVGEGLSLVEVHYYKSRLQANQNYPAMRLMPSTTNRWGRDVMRIVK